MSRSDRVDADARETHDRELFDRIALRYALKDVVPSTSLARRYLIEEALAPVLARRRDLGTVVDVGCGVGAPALYLRGRYDKYVGIDQSANVIAAARELNRDNPTATFVNMNVKDVVLPDRADLMLVLGALHHMTEPDRVLTRLKTLAAPRAYLVLVEPSRSNPVVQGLRVVRGLVDSAYSREQHFFSRWELRQLLERHGLQDVESVYLGYFTPPLAQVVLPFRVLATALSRLAVRADRVLHRGLPDPLRFLAWNLAVRGRFP